MRCSWASALGMMVLSVLATSYAGGAQIAIPDGLTHEHIVAPGDHIEGRIRVSCTAEVPVTVTVDLRDYLFFADGTTLYADPGTVERSSSSWLELLTAEPIVVAPGDEATIVYTLDIPDDGALRGTYWCILLVGPAPTASPATSPGLSITTVLNYGVQIVTHIGDSGTRSVRAVGTELTESDGSITLSVDLENDGERWVRPDVWAELYAEDGTRLLTVDSGRLRIYPGTSVRHRFGFGDLAPGTYRAVVLIDDQGTAAWAAQFTLHVVEEAD